MIIPISKVNRPKRLVNKKLIDKNKYFFTFNNTKFFYSQEDKDMLVELKKNAYKNLNIKICKKNLLKIRWLFNTFKIPFYLVFGTLLGAIRDNGFIKHDNDVDIAILDRYVEDLCALLESNLFKMSGFKIVKAMKGIITFTRDSESIDIFIYSKYNNKYKCYTPWLIYHDPAPFFDNPSVIEFLGQEFQTVQNPKRYLSLHYGRGWRKPRKNRHASF